MDAFEQAWAEVETLFSDPELDAMVGEVREINELLRDQPVSQEEAEHLIEELDAKWREKGLTSKRMLVTGPVYANGEHEAIQETLLDDQHRMVLNRNSFVSASLSLLNNPIIDAAGVHIEQQVTLLGYVDLEIDGDDGETEMDMVLCNIPLEEGTVLEHESVTGAKASAWMNIYQPDLKAEIDAMLMDAANEASATMGLKEVMLWYVSVEKKAIKEHKKFLQAYLSRAITYERYVPYLVELLGDCETFDPRECEYKKSTIMSQKKSLVMMKELYLRKNNKAEMFDIWVRSTLVGTSKQEATELCMPLSTVLSIESGRELLRDH